MTENTFTRPQGNPNVSISKKFCHCFMNYFSLSVAPAGHGSHEIFRAWTGVAGRKNRRRKAQRGGAGNKAARAHG